MICRLEPARASRQWHRPRSEASAPTWCRNVPTLLLAFSDQSARSNRTMLSRDRMPAERCQAERVGVDGPQRNERPGGSSHYGTRVRGVFPAETGQGMGSRGCGAGQSCRQRARGRRRRTTGVGSRDRPRRGAEGVEETRNENHLGNHGYPYPVRITCYCTVPVAISK